jgi:hypothetical protein
MIFIRNLKAIKKLFEEIKFLNESSFKIKVGIVFDLIRSIKKSNPNTILINKFIKFFIAKN